MAIASESKQKLGEPSPVSGKARRRPGPMPDIVGSAWVEGHTEPIAIPNIADYFPPEARKWGRIFFATLGLALSALGVIGTIVAYLLLSSALSNSEKLILSQIDGANSAIFDLGSSVDGLASAGGDAASSTQSLAGGLRGFSTASAGIANSLDGLADSLSGAAVLGVGSQASGLREQARMMRGASGNFSDSAASAESAGEQIGNSFEGLRNLKQDMAQIGANLESSREGAKNAFGTLSLALLVGAIVLLLLFASMGCACIATLL